MIFTKILKTVVRDRWGVKQSLINNGEEPY